MMGGWPAWGNPPTLQQNQNPWILPDSNGTISPWGHFSGWGYPGVIQQLQPPLPLDPPPPPPPPPPPHPHPGLPQGKGDFNFRAPSTLGPYSSSTFQTSRPAVVSKSTLHNSGWNSFNPPTSNTIKKNPYCGDAITPSTPLMNAASRKSSESPYSIHRQEIRNHSQIHTTNKMSFLEMSYNKISLNFGKDYKGLMNLLDNNMGGYKNPVQVINLIHKLGQTFVESWKIKKMHKDSEYISVLFWTMVNWDNVKIKALLWVIVQLQNSKNGPLSFTKDDKALTDIIRQLNTLKMDWKIETLEFLALRYHLLGQKRNADFLTKEIDGIINNLMKGRGVTVNPTAKVFLRMEQFIREPSDYIKKEFVSNYFNNLLLNTTQSMTALPMTSTSTSMLDAFSKHVATFQHLTTKKAMICKGVSTLNKIREVFYKSRRSSHHDQTKFLDILFQHLTKLNNYGIKAVLWVLECIIRQINAAEAKETQQSSAFVRGYCQLFQHFDTTQSDWKSDIVELLTIKNGFAMQNKMKADNLQRIDELVEKMTRDKNVFVNVSNSFILGIGNVSAFYPSSEKGLNTFQTFIQEQFQKLLPPWSTATKSTSSGIQNVEDFLQNLLRKPSLRKPPLRKPSLQKSLPQIISKRRVMGEISSSDSDSDDDHDVQSCKSLKYKANRSIDETVKTPFKSTPNRYHEPNSREGSGNVSTSTLELELPPKENKFLRRFSRIRHSLNLLNKENMDNTGLKGMERMVKWFTKNQNRNNGLDNSKFFAQLFQEIPALNNYGIKAVMWAFCGMVGVISFSEAVEFRKKGYFKLQELLDRFDMSKCNWKAEVIEFLAIRRRLFKGKKINDECLTRINNLVKEIASTKAEIDLDAYIQSFKSSAVITYHHFYPNKTKKNEIQGYNSLIEKHIDKLVLQEFPELLTIEEEEGSLVMEDNARPIQVENSMPRQPVVESEPDSGPPTIDLDPKDEASSVMKIDREMHANPTTKGQDCRESVNPITAETVEPELPEPAMEKLKCQLLQRLCKITPKNLETLMKNVPTSFEEDLAQNNDPKDMTETKPSATINTTAPITDEKSRNYVIDRPVQERLAYLCLIGKAKLKSGTLEPPLEGCSKKRQSYSFRRFPNMQNRKRKGDKILETSKNPGIKGDKKKYESRTYSEYLSQFTWTNVEISTIEITLPTDFTGEDYVNHISAESYISHRLQMVDNVYFVIILHCTDLYSNNLETNTLKPESKIVKQN